ncbi:MULTISPECIES: hypothetical protein [unclassified Variovorax]|uniref:hypothetical protein n=1 Tax=unclassified Variovorax TaxID=663243 RepID=UPI0008C03ADD|nr:MULTISPECIES: hypothetical protein [unclassified Variovorax]SEK15384.1 hypothetical protein SAMN05518853_11798 [Variovorax sp. OK202]SFE13941.1 hypothetical protein SAMN05444746_11798 [Variovorax sp. OK212]
MSDALRAGSVSPTLRAGPVPLALRAGSVAPALRAGSVPLALRAAVALALLAGVAPRADAVFTYAPTSSAAYGITLQVGAATGIDEVVFNATGANAGLATGTSIPGSQSIIIRVSPARPARLLVENRPVTLTATVPAGLSCTTAASCSATVIPFSTISWVSTNATSPAEGDIQSGAFVAGSTQTLASFDGATATILLVNGDTRFMSNTLTFRYANTTVYPAGSYSGTVRFTATML